MRSLVFPMPMAGRATDSVARGGEFLHFAIYWQSISMLSSRMLPARTAHIASQIDKQKASPPKMNMLVEHLCHFHDLDTPIILRGSVAFCLSCPIIPPLANHCLDPNQCRQPYTRRDTHTCSTTPTHTHRHRIAAQIGCTSFFPAFGLFASRTIV